MKKLIILIAIIITSISCASNKAKIDYSKSVDKKSIAKALSEKDYNAIAEVVAYYHKLKRDTPSLYNFEDENELNRFGYQLLNNGKIKDAIEIFKLLVSEFPDSSNPYDSLAEAYYTDKRQDLSLKNYQKSLALNPKNINAEDWIDRIKYPTIDTTKFAKIYTVQQYKDDLDELGRRLSEVNPNAYKFIAKEDFWKAIEDKKELITNQTTYGEFIWHCSEIIANINCGHTSMGYFFQESGMLPIPLRFPLETQWINNKLYISNALINKDRVSEKAEIISINGMPVASIKNDIYKHISSQGYIETYKKNFFNAHSTSIIPYSLGFPESYKIELKGKTKPIILEKLNAFKSDLTDYSVKRCEEHLCLDYSADKKIAFLTIRTFSYYRNELPVFQKFIDDSFKEIKDKNITNLIIDVRYNGGGSSDAGIYLLKYLSNKPFTYFSISQSDRKKKEVKPFEHTFKGNIYFTIDGNGSSTTGHFISLIKDLSIGTLIGEELGSNQFCTAGQKRLRLPNTEVGYMVGRMTFKTTVNSFPDQKGIIPDYHVTQSIDDYLDNIDTVLEYTIQLIDKY